MHRHAREALIIGHARAALMLIAARANLPVFEYPPGTVKRAVVGSGRAEKMQVNGMIRAILGLRAAPAIDASDALAVAVCHAGALVLPKSAVPEAKPPRAARAPRVRRTPHAV